ncbi:MAG: hypothetical protein ABSF33_18680 [Acidimicrobiales bacterium]|jgi:hypothetical protein
MEIIGSLDEIAAAACREADRARIDSYEYLSVHVGPYEAMLLFGPDAIFGEVVSNVLLPADDALSPEQESRLESLGWAQPEHPLQPSFHRTWSTLSASETIVRDLLTAFICVAELAEGEQVGCSGGAWCGSPGAVCAYDCGGDDGEGLPGVREPESFGHLGHRSKAARSQRVGVADVNRRPQSRDDGLNIIRRFHLGVREQRKHGPN